jgi:hypothetical protein
MAGLSQFRVTIFVGFCGFQTTLAGEARKEGREILVS